MKECYYLASLSNPSKILAIAEMTPRQKLKRNFQLRKKKLPIRWASLKTQLAAS